MTSTERRPRGQTPLSDEAFVALIMSEPNLDFLHVTAGLSPEAFVARAKSLGVDDLLYEAAPVGDYRLLCKRSCASELAALNAAYPGEAYRDVSNAPRDIRPATNPPLLKYAA